MSFASLRHRKWIIKALYAIYAARQRHVKRTLLLSSGIKVTVRRTMGTAPRNRFTVHIGG